MNLHPATAQETAAEYLNAGLWQDGTDVLLQMTAAAPDKSRIHPMAYYYLGYFADKLGQPAKAAEYDKLAMAMPPDYVFPFQNEAIDVLRAAMKANPGDPRAPYYLGNVLYDWQPEEATKMWEASAGIDPSFAIVHRNLATAYLHQKPEGDVNRAIAELEKAVAADRKYPLHFAELDELYEQTGVPLQKRIDLVNRNAAVVAQRDDAQNRAIALKISTGAYDEAIQMMTDRPFAVAEGANLNVAEHWTDAHILRARRRLGAKQYQDAVADLQAATAIPANLPLGPAAFGAAARNAEVAYWRGVAYEGLGDHQKAIESWHSAETPAQTVAGRAGAQPYFQALALTETGSTGESQAAFCRPCRVRKIRVATGHIRGPRQRRPGAVAPRPHGQCALPHRPRIPGPERLRAGEGRAEPGGRNQPRPGRRSHRSSLDQITAMASTCGRF